MFWPDDIKVSLQFRKFLICDYFPDIQVIALENNINKYGISLHAKNYQRLDHGFVHIILKFPSNSENLTDKQRYIKYIFLCSISVELLWNSEVRRNFWKYKSRSYDLLVLKFLSD